MNTLTAIEERRSVKHYDPSHKLSETEIRQLLDATLLSPTSFNIQNWRFVVVTDQAQQDALRAVSWDQAQVSEASATILICANLKAYENGERYWVNAPEPVREMLVPMIAPFYQDNPQLQRDEAMRSTGLAGQTLMLAAKSLGYDSCPMIGFDPEKVAELIKLPENHIIGMMVTVGKALKPANPRGGQLPYGEVVFANQFPG
ncbi:nitroreductase family protein [Coraliomargarita akajimensis]|uniref:Nitroreductase n=1 Tax=Coraliomargarita akajimensis (strain DSM 45221 / IAM 15411 / JCM 23193 / KCTC 12865 / 04OKA010-24) TaxID=583355 RepID=D5EKL8_CORAD|nr:nitroreductase family protein [Coraliomargarita akajimensis]ADE54925.1 nitroreductase [Coraliomargarita akajimensis DSM 45221]